jgi:hypothetical protein
LCLLLLAPLMAQDVPPALRDWQGWVLHDVPQHACPLLADGASERPESRQCAWPGRLTLMAGGEGASFAMQVRVDAPAWVALPGDARAWPQQVAIDQQPATVLARDGVPMLWLQPGDYQLRGTLPWTTRPARVRVPQSIGLVTLAVDGAAVTQVERHADELTLGEAAAAQRTADALAVRVYRQLADGLPATLETRVQLDVAGSARELLLGPALPSGFVATSLSGDLPARLESDGRLRVQLRPGQWTVTLDARSVGNVDKVALRSAVAPWPAQETWSYRDDPDLRGTRAQGQAVDPAQAGVPMEWRELPAFALSARAGLGVEPGARGDEGVRGEQLRLQRELWLDFDGRGLRVEDHLSGELRHQQRLDVVAPWQLQRASQGGQPLLISRGERGRSGIELRTRQLALSAGLRLPSHAGAIPSNGWQVPLESIDATLHLPPGYRLLGSTGTDRSPASWVAQWSLLDLFVVALIALLAGRLLGWRWAALAAALLVLAQHEHGAPRWTLALVLALALLMRALPEGRLRLAARTGALLMLTVAVLCALPFAGTQLQYALHPQLQAANVAHVATPAGPVREVAVDTATRSAPAPAPAAPPAVEEASNYAASAAKASLPPPPPPPPSPVSGKASLIQAGAGTPQWDVGNDYALSWSGPVTPTQVTRLFIAPAWLVALLRVLMVALLVALLAQLARSLWPATAGWRWRWRVGRGAGVAGAALLLVALLPAVGHAQSTPASELLSQLRSRLLEAPRCAPSCVDVAQLALQVEGDTLEMTLEAHVGAPSAVPLPQTDDALRLLDVSVDGQSTDALARGADGTLLLRLERGVHRVGLRYRVGDADTTSVQFALPPRRVSFNAPGWSLAGVEDGRALGQGISLQRVRNQPTGTAGSVAQGFPRYVRVTRQLDLGVDWTVQNSVRRIAPREGGFTVEVPLLPGEHPLGDGARIKDGRIAITFNADDDVARWSSRLDHAPQLALTAPALGERAEEWRIDSAPMWHVDARGVPTSASAEGLRFQPLPGETLQLRMSEPVALAGASLAFDRAAVDSQAGARATETTLQLSARSTRGGEHAIGLPSGAELLQATRDGVALNLPVRDGKLSLPLLPGSHDYGLRVRQPGGVGVRTATPSFALGAAVANIDLALRMPHDRWVLWAWGPGLGPAVLYWSQLLVLLLAAWLLARVAPTPLRFRHWLLLGLGFSAFAWTAYALVVAWLILLGLRARHVPPAGWSALRFNALQAALATLTALALLTLVGAVPAGLLGAPDMHVAGNGSTAWNLRWFADQSGGMLPTGGVLSVSLWFYKLAMLAWALWLANALIGWLRWGFGAWSSGGYWRKRELKIALPPQLPSAPSAPTGPRRDA